MKTIVNSRALITVLMALFTINVFAQSWGTRGNAADGNDFIGTINDEPLLIKTDSIDRIIVGVNDTVEFKGLAVFDSIIKKNSRQLFHPPCSASPRTC